MKEHEQATKNKPGSKPHTPAKGSLATVWIAMK
jgi:hypothetical protein